MSDALISSLQTRINDLQGENATLKAENKDRRLKLRDRSAEVETIKAQIADLTKERDALKASLDSAPATADERVKALEAQIRHRDVRDAFRSAPLAPGIKIDQIFKFFDVDPATVDMTKAEELVKGWREAAPGLFRTSDDGQSQTQAQAAPGGATQGQGGRSALDLTHLAGRGGRDNGPQPATYTRAEVAQAGWETQRPELAAALKAGTAKLVQG